MHTVENNHHERMFRVAGMQTINFSVIDVPAVVLHFLQSIQHRNQLPADYFQLHLHMNTGLPHNTQPSGLVRYRLRNLHQRLLPNHPLRWCRLINYDGNDLHTAIDVEVDVDDDALEYGDDGGGEDGSVDDDLAFHKHRRYWVLYKDCTNVRIVPYLSSFDSANRDNHLS